MKIHWNGFLKHAVKKYPEEVCAFIFSWKPYATDEEWFVFCVENIHSEPKIAWIPHKKQLVELKKKAKELGLTRIGTIHSHPKPSKKEKIEDLLLPSEIDLGYAKRYNDIIRGVIVCCNKAIYGIRFHDQFGNEIPIYMEDKE